MIFFKDKNKKMNIQIWISHHDSLAGWLPVGILLFIQQLVATLDKHQGFDRCNKKTYWLCFRICLQCCWQHFQKIVAPKRATARVRFKPKGAFTSSTGMKKARGSTIKFPILREQYQHKKHRPAHFTCHSLSSHIDCSNATVLCICEKERET